MLTLKLFLSQMLWYDEKSKKKICWGLFPGTCCPITVRGWVQEDIAWSCARKGLGWTAERISSWKGLSGIEESSFLEVFRNNWTWHSVLWPRWQGGYSQRLDSITLTLFSSLSDSVALCSRQACHRNFQWPNQVDCTRIAVSSPGNPKLS